jgi:carbon monoxide dehydrogenase subunit G
MKLEHDFTVQAPPEQAWNVLLDMERVAPCLPGAALDGGDGTEFAGSMTVKLGPVTNRYRGTIRIEEADRAAMRAVLRAEGRDAGGAGGAAATITTRLESASGATRVRVETDLAISGPAARFGRGVMQDVSGRLMREFADCLAGELGRATATVTAGSGNGEAPTVAPAYQDTEVGRLPVGPAGDAALAAARAGDAAPRRPDTSDGDGASAEQAAPPRERRTAEVLDLGAASRAAIVRRVVPALAAASLAAAALVVLRRSRR